MSQTQARTQTESIFRGLSIFKSVRSPKYHCRIYVGNNKHIVKSTGETSKIEARKVAMELFHDLQNKKRIGVPDNQTFKFFSNKLIEQELLKKSKRLGSDTKSYILRDEYGLDAYFGDTNIKQITTHDIRLYLEKLDKSSSKPLAHSTKSKYLIAIKKVFRIAYEMTIIDKIPLLPKLDSRLKDNPRPSFNEKEYKKLLKVTREEVEKGVKVRGIPLTMEHYYFIVFMVHTFLRPIESEIFSIKHKDIKVIKEKPERLEIQVMGKTGYRQVSSLSYAVDFYEKLCELNKGNTEDDFVFFPDYKNRRTALRNFNRQFGYLLDQSNLRTDSFGTRRTPYGLRHYSLQTRLRMSKGKVNIYWLAKNAGTSVEQLERFYLKNMELNDEIVQNLQTFG